MRNFNYLRDIIHIIEVLSIIREYKNVLYEYDMSVFSLEEKSLIEEFRKMVDEFLVEFDMPWPNDLGSVINNELLAPEVVNNLKPPKYQYPHDASSTGCKVENIINKLFHMEIEVFKIISKKWNVNLTAFSDLKNGDNFMFVGSVINNPEFLPCGKYYRNNGHAYTSATLFTPQMLESFMEGKLLVTCEVDENNLMAMSEIDIATREQEYSDIKTIGVVDRTDFKYIAAGYSWGGKPCTKLLTPQLLEKRRVELNKKENATINEVILDKEKTRYTGLILFSNGFDCLLSEYLTCLEAKKNMGLDFKYINTSLYKKDFIDIAALENLSSQIQSFLEWYESQVGKEITLKLLTSYIKDVVEQMSYNEDVKKIFYSELDNYKKRIGYVM